MLQNSEASSRFLKWAIELGQFDVNFLPRTVIKWQALVEFTYADIAEVAGSADIIEAVKVVEAQEEKNSALAKGDAKQWTLYVDSASNDTGSGVGIMLISPEGHKIHCALRFGFRHQIMRPNTRPL